MNVNSRRILPNFLYIGPDKSGSTWMYRMLQQHPECHVPRVKDIYFFDRHYGRGLDWYASFFQHAPEDARAIGELSHDYLFSADAAARILRDLPGVRLFTSLRNPVERSFSQYLYMVRSGMTRGPFEEAVHQFPEIIDNSMYHRHLVRYAELFEPSRLAVFLFDELVLDPRGFGRRMFDYLGLAADVELDFDRTVLPASRPRSARLARLAKEGANWTRRLGLPGLVGAVKGSYAAQWLYAPYEKSDRPSLSPDERRRLVDVFRPDLEQLETLIRRDLGQWMQQESR